MACPEAGVSKKEEKEILFLAGGADRRGAREMPQSMWQRAPQPQQQHDERFVPK